MGIPRDGLINHDGVSIDAMNLQGRPAFQFCWTIMNLNITAGKYIALYFGAQWCPTCKDYSARLDYRYREIRSLSQGFEVVFVSLDRSAESAMAYFSTMPWLMLTYEHRDIQSQLMHRYEVIQCVCNSVGFDAC